jgi:two-component system chemotaxis sensor kinase CheA
VGQVSATGSVDQFRHSFCEEARDVLVDLESALLELNESRLDQGLVGRVFRGLHTLKGSGAMFGFDELAGFTHNLETAFDEVRNGRQTVGSELIDLTLEALDRIRVLLEDDAGKAAAEAGIRAEILSRLKQLTGSSEPGPAKPAAEVPASGGGEVRDWHIHFAPGADMMRTGADPFLLLRELGQMGGLSVRASMAAVPPLRELDPERCYVSWEMVLATTADRDAIRDVFIFVDDCCELSIEPASVASSEPKEGFTAREACATDLTARALEEPRAAWP